MKSDEQALEQAGLFDEVHLSFSGPLGHRQVTLLLRGKPLPVAQLGIRLYGLLGQGNGQAPVGLPLTPGQIYTAPLADETRRELEHSYSKPGWTTKAYEHDDLAPRPQLRVSFDLLAYENDQLWIDGRQVSPAATKH